MRHRTLALALAATWLAALPVLAHAAGALYWLDTRYAAPTLNRADAAGTQIAGVALDVASQPEGLAVDANGRLYWAEANLSGARIMLAAPNLASITPLVTLGSALRGIAIDDVAHFIYWTSSNLLQPKVTRAAMDGSGVTVLNAMVSASNPRGIAVDHAGGKYYFADFDQDVIYQANLDGSALTQWLALPAQSHPYGVAFDAGTQRLYWTEYTGKLRYIPVAGGVMTTVASGLTNPTYLVLDPASALVYWAEAGAGVQHVYRAPMNGGARTLLPTPVTTYGGLAFQPNYGLPVPLADGPAEFALAPLAPNPARGPLEAAFTLPREAHARLSVLDLQGREIAVLEDAVLAAGRHTAAWNTAARPAAPGMYFVRFAADGRTWTRRVVIAR